MGRQTLTVRVETETRRALDAIATAIDRDRSYVMNEALSSYIETHRWQVEHIRQGLSEAEAGRFAANAEVTRVLNRLRRK